MARHAGFRRGLTAGYHEEDDGYDYDDDNYNSSFGSYADSPSVSGYIVGSALKKKEAAVDDADLLKPLVPLVKDAVPASVSKSKIEEALRRSNYDVDVAVDDLLYFEPEPEPQAQPQTGGSKKKKPEKRIDPSDGGAYTKAEFIAEYGGTREWDKAKPLNPAPKPAPKPKPASKPKAAKPKESKIVAPPKSPLAKQPSTQSNDSEPSGLAQALSSPSTPLCPKLPLTFKQQARAVSPVPLPKAEYETVADSDGKHRLSVVVVGHVDAGKSTIMGHILFKLGLVAKKTMHKFEKESREKGKASFHFAWVLDEQEEERERGVTIDVGVTYFETPTKHITLLDAPGHKDFVANMISGAAQADVAILVVNAAGGEFESGFELGGQTREHVILLKSLGVNELIVAVNKMDTIDYNQDRYDKIQADLKPFLKGAGFNTESDVRFCPVAGLVGENLAKMESEQLKSWYKGESLLDLIDKLKPAERLTKYPLRLCISDVFKTQSLGITVAGKIETGKLSAGDKVLLMPSNETYTVKSMERQNLSCKEALAGDNVEVGLQGVTDMQVLSIGQVMCSPSNPVKVVSKFFAQLLTFKSERPITMGYPAVIHVHVLMVSCTISRLVGLLDKNLQITKKKPKCLPKDQSTSCIVEITVSRPIPIELFAEFRTMGRFMLREQGKTIAAGVVKEMIE